MKATIQGTLSFEEREAKKDKAYNDHERGLISDLKLFEILSYVYWQRQCFPVSRHEYRCHLSRAMKLSGESVLPDVLKKYPPPSGVLKIAPGCSDFYPHGLPKGLIFPGRR